MRHVPCHSHWLDWLLMRLAASHELWFGRAAHPMLHPAGYSTGDPSKRTPGAIASGLIHVLLILGTGVTGVRISTGLF